MGQIYLVRHGQASFGAANYDHLSTLGFEQARLLGQWFANSRQTFNRVVCGGMVRHRQTADTCFSELPRALLADTEWITDPGFAEFDHVEVLVKHCPEFADPVRFKAYVANHPEPKRAFEHTFVAGMQRWMGGELDHDYTESWSGFQERCVGALERVAASAEPGDSTIVFTSGGVISAICKHLLDLPAQKSLELNWSIANCSVTKLQHRPGKTSLNYLNNYAHLEWLGEANSVTYR
ncbi:histidine phosphatase family protein [Pseudoduganella namucuonensis]|uniref:Broad specificity phosphatase PhoE n=1 Tax=Pseudoduganella namucuonensis TaxID=1035707 RepID=A0A1I7F5D9_9BURK|nr:histidine phosphatase family protein [Pseudoduganella namucuonensis]SFU31364.1 Broad specificity phosphatase PhoE [Pseudoduganella namucuonensis]